MKLNLPRTIFALALLTTLTLSNAGGRAGSANQGNTGAPGDQMSGNNPRTCQSCHATGNIQVRLSLEVLDKDNNPINTYTANEIYTAKVSIDSTDGPRSNGYGFQMVSLFDTDNNDVNGWTDDGHSDNVQIEKSTRTDRVYAEQNGTSDFKEFLVQWKAPTTGSGDVSFYATGVSINRNGSTSGDGATNPQKLTLSENTTSNIAELSSVGIDIQFAPNPVKDQLFLTINSKKNEVISITIMSPTGQLFYTKTLNLTNEEKIESIDLSNLPQGIYFLQTTNGAALSSKKIIKL